MLYLWDKKGSLVEQAIKVENLDKEIDWNEHRDIDQVSQQRAVISQANELVSQFDENEMREEFESEIRDKIQSVASKQPQEFLPGDTNYSKWNTHKLAQGAFSQAIVGNVEREINNGERMRSSQSYWHRF